VALWFASLAPVRTQPIAGAAPANGDSEHLSLADVQGTAFARNWDLLAAKSGVDTATAQLIVAKEFPNPTASWSTAKIGTHDTATPVGNGVWSRSYDTIAAVSQLIEIAGKRHDRQMAGRAAIMGASARFHDAKRTLDQGVTKAYIAALLAVENVRVLNQSAGYLQHEAEIAKVRFEAGDISESDRKQIEINAEQFGLQARAAEAAAIQARIAVEVLMGRNQPKGNWQPTQTLEDLVGAFVPPNSETKANRIRPDVWAAEADLKSSQAQLRLQKAMRIPDPTISLGYEHEPPGGGPPADTMNFGVSFPLPLWNRNGGNIKAAQAAVEQSEVALGKVRAQAAADIANADVEYHEARARWQRYQEQIRPKSSGVREAVAYAYEKGGASLVDLLDAERTDNDVRLATAQAMSDTASASADVKAARAVLSEGELSSNK
jgi:cobalt-zinc-cadmium efflux system outer membrane protein